MKRKICVVTGSRADYGLLKLVMKGIKVDPDLALQIIATGMHLSPTYGLTYKEIEGDGFVIDYMVESLLLSDTPADIAQATAKSMMGCAKAFGELEPDLVLILGDRFEILAAATAAVLARIPIAHIHGGEVTVGAYDEAFRHSITKMANIHFVATEEYRRRVIQLGENPSSVHFVGGLGVDAIRHLNFLSKDEIEQTLGIKFSSKSLLVTFHPSTLEELTPIEQVNELLAALIERPEIMLIFTMPNADTGGLEIMEQINKFVKERSNAYSFKSLGQQQYLSCMAQVDGILGNSSSGILEAPSLKVGSINIGTRQLGRVQSESVINCVINKEHITSSIDKLYSRGFQLVLDNCTSPYGEGGASNKIIKMLREYKLDGISRKVFYDLTEVYQVGFLQ
jgi:GDP/UDP-N,N'-diacetylbacillosamine 2-epimerase (hydrolysing)